MAAESHCHAIRELDLTELSFVDLAGLRVLAAAISTLQARQAVSVVGMRDIVRRLARLVTLDDQLRPAYEGEPGTPTA
jgi:anti-anti-sigma regulatory factor